MIEMTMSEYAKHLLLKHFEEKAAEEGIKIVDKKTQPRLATDNVIVEFPKKGNTELD